MKNALSTVYSYNGYGRRVVIFRFENEMVLIALSVLLKGLKAEYVYNMYIE